MTDKPSTTHTSLLRRLSVAYLIDSGHNTVPLIIEATGMPRRTAQDTESKLDSKYDWKAKWRHLFIKSLGTALFIILLLFVGWLVKSYEWAELPYSGLFKSVVPFPKP